MINMLIIPKIKIANTAIKYPSKLVSYDTIDIETESQCGQRTFYDLKVID